MTSQFDEQLDRAIEVAAAHESDLLNYPGVVAVGVGPRRTAGVIAGEAAIVVTVRSKRAESDLEARGERPLPQELDGVPVDVVEQHAAQEAPEIVAAQQAANDVLDRVRDEWLREANITGIGVTYKTAAGRTDYRRIALTLFVAEKLPPDEVRRRQLRFVPPEIAGVPTDVTQLPPMRPTSSASGSRDDRKDPIVGGITIGVNTKPFWYGTLGAIVFDRSSGDQLVLSNQHVLDGPQGTEVVQPSPIGLDDSLEIGFQLDICNPSHFFRLDTPNTTVGSVLAGAAVACLTAAALSDEIDPTRRGQDATPPPPGALTLSESHSVSLSYPELPIPGTHFDIKTDWKYTRHANQGDLEYGVTEVKQNPHVLVDKLLLTDKLLYQPGDTILLFGLILPEACAPGDSDGDPYRELTPEEIEALSGRRGPAPGSLTNFASRPARSSNEDPAVGIVVPRCSCGSFQATALLTPTSVDRAFPIVLREPVRSRRSGQLTKLFQILSARGDKELLRRATRLLRYGCLYTGTLTVDGIPLGGWNHYLYVQTVNTAHAGMKPTQAAQIIGGLPVSQNTTPQLDFACGPGVFEDGQFDIEPETPNLASPLKVG